jgi:hypothetical protein
MFAFEPELSSVHAEVTGADGSDHPRIVSTYIWSYSPLPTRLGKRDGGTACGANLR